VIELDLAVGRHSGVPLETRGAISLYDAARDVLELHGAAKVPHRNKDTLVRMLGLAPAQIRLHEGHTGGGFGVRGEQGRAPPRHRRRILPRPGRLCAHPRRKRRGRTMSMLTGAYKVGAYRAAGHFRLTNKTPVQPADVGDAQGH
jgi:hypothetical protein